MRGRWRYENPPPHPPEPFPHRACHASRRSCVGARIRRDPAASVIDGHHRLAVRTPRSGACAVSATSPPSISSDVVIVGARVAGAATAMLLAQAGLDVIVVDRSGYGLDTLSTHALMRAAVTQLR